MMARATKSARGLWPLISIFVLFGSLSVDPSASAQAGWPSVTPYPWMLEQIWEKITGTEENWKNSELAARKIRRISLAKVYKKYLPVITEISRGLATLQDKLNGELFPTEEGKCHPCFECFSEMAVLRAERSEACKKVLVPVLARAEHLKEVPHIPNGLVLRYSGSRYTRTEKPSLGTVLLSDFRAVVRDYLSLDADTLLDVQDEARRDLLFYHGISAYDYFREAFELRSDEDFFLPEEEDIKDFLTEAYEWIGGEAEEDASVEELLDQLYWEVLVGEDNLQWRSELVEKIFFTLGPSWAEIVREGDFNDDPDGLFENHCWKGFQEDGRYVFEAEIETDLEDKNAVRFLLNSIEKAWSGSGNEDELVLRLKPKFGKGRPNGEKALGLTRPGNKPHSAGVDLEALGSNRCIVFQTGRVEQEVRYRTLFGSLAFGLAPNRRLEWVRLGKTPKIQQLLFAPEEPTLAQELKVDKKLRQKAIEQIQKRISNKEFEEAIDTLKKELREMEPIPRRKKSKPRFT